MNTNIDRKRKYVQITGQIHAALDCSGGSQRRPDVPARCFISILIIWSI